MGKLKLRGKDLRDIGYPQGPVISAAINAVTENYPKVTKNSALEMLENILLKPQAFLEDTDLCHLDAFSSTEVSGAKAYISSSILLLASRRCSAEDGYRALGG